MESGPIRFSSILVLVSVISTATLLISACQPVTTPSQEETAVIPSKTQFLSTDTPTPLPTLPVTPPILPGIYQSLHLNPLDTPHAYINDACTYLRDKWDSHNSPPGTVVMIVMLHSINKGIPQGGDVVNVTTFTKMMEELHGQQFQAINTGQLADFLENNARIPARSVVLIQDGRRYAENFNKHFRPYWDSWGWPVVNAWDTQADSTDALWNENIALEKEGWVDHQVYGLPIDAGLVDKLSDNYFTGELQKEFTAFQQHFNKSPVAIVWPTGFALRPAQIAQQLGYQLGFTANARGPVMFNWVPLAETTDNMRPSYAPEAAVDSPLMTLPRYNPFQVHGALDTVRVIGKEAAAYAEQNKASELEYYDIVCSATYGPIP
jgi:hypothetical protein